MDTRVKYALIYAAYAVVFAALFFIPAGTLYYWQAWNYLAVVVVSAIIFGAYFLSKDPSLMEGRLNVRENSKEQQLVQKFGGILFLIAFLLPGLDRRFGWSAVPLTLVFAADALILLSFALLFWVFSVNSYGTSTIKVVKGQKVVSIGPYAIVRHPMYFCAILFFVATPIALGSYIALPLFILTIPGLAYRIINEEKVLNKELKGYKEYAKKVKYRLVPGIW